MMWHFFSEFSEFSTQSLLPFWLNFLSQQIQSAKHYSAVSICRNRYFSQRCWWNIPYFSSCVPLLSFWHQRVQLWSPGDYISVFLMRIFFPWSCSFFRNQCKDEFFDGSQQTDAWSEWQLHGQQWKRSYHQVRQQTQFGQQCSWRSHRALEQPGLKGNDLTRPTRRL